MVLMDWVGLRVVVALTEAQELWEMDTVEEEQREGYREPVTDTEGQWEELGETLPERVALGQWDGVTDTDPDFVPVGDTE